MMGFFEEAQFRICVWWTYWRSFPAVFFSSSLNWSPKSWTSSSASLYMWQQEIHLTNKHTLFLFWQGITQGPPRARKLRISPQTMLSHWGSSPETPLSPDPYRLAHTHFLNDPKQPGSCSHYLAWSNPPLYRCNHLYDFTLNDPLGFFGVFHLFCNRDLIALFNENINILLGRVVGTPAIGIGFSAFLFREVKKSLKFEPHSLHLHKIIRKISHSKQQKASG